MIKKASIIAAVALANLACNTSSYVESVPTEAWNDSLIFEWENKDSTGRLNIALLLRYKRHDADSVVKLRVLTKTPLEKSILEEVEIRLMPNGKKNWGVSEVIEQDYRHNVNFTEIGTYTFNISPTKKTNGIEAVGIIFDK